MIDFKKKHRIIPPRKHYQPMRFVGWGLILMLLIIFLLYKLIVK
ncbi:MAG: hypothetical protein N3A65_06540 [candidate division WOR-3 bacterium]|nr:hypothetical protein [candidate division WOR-3 bacterium]